MIMIMICCPIIVSIATLSHNKVLYKFGVLYCFLSDSVSVVVVDDIVLLLVYTFRLLNEQKTKESRWWGEVQQQQIKVYRLFVTEVLVVINGDDANAKADVDVSLTFRIMQNNIASMCPHV